MRCIVGLPDELSRVELSDLLAAETEATDLQRFVDDQLGHKEAFDHLPKTVLDCTSDL